MYILSDVFAGGMLGSFYPYFIVLLHFSYLKEYYKVFHLNDLWFVIISTGIEVT